ncbi:MAG: hypothetical protein LBH93_05790, partial [Chitinispirillales bacterium]|nr:hypothetical protein [Chitinispirillales bacterium]
MRPLRKFIPRRVRHALLGWAARLGFAIGKTLPRGAGLMLFSLLGALCYRVLREDRRRTADNLRAVFGNEWSEKKIRAVSIEVFRSLGKNLFDAISLEAMSAEKFDKTVSHDSLEALAKARDRGKGIIAITA